MANKSLMEYAEALQELIEQSGIFEDVQVGLSLTPEIDISKAVNLQIYVIPVGVDREFMTRGKIEKGFNLEVCILKHIKAESDQQDLLEMGESLGDFLIGLSIGDSGIIVQSSGDPIFDGETIREKNIVKSFINVKISEL